MLPEPVGRDCLAQIVQIVNSQNLMHGIDQLIPFPRHAEQLRPGDTSSREAEVDWSGSRSVAACSRQAARSGGTVSRLLPCLRRLNKIPPHAGTSSERGTGGH